MSLERKARAYVAAVEGGAVGEVIGSRAPAIAVGSIVMSNKGWRDRFVGDPRDGATCDAPWRIAAKADGTSLAAPQGKPEWTPMAA